MIQTETDKNGHKQAETFRIGQKTDRNRQIAKKQT